MCSCCVCTGILMMVAEASGEKERATLRGCDNRIRLTNIMMLKYTNSSSGRKKLCLVLCFCWARAFCKWCEIVCWAQKCNVFARERNSCETQYSCFLFARTPVCVWCARHTNKRRFGSIGSLAPLFWMSFHGVCDSGSVPFSKTHSAHCAAWGISITFNHITEAASKLMWYTLTHTHRSLLYNLLSNFF